MKMRFSWTPDPSQASTAGIPYTMTLHVTDDGSPSLSTDRTFTITAGGHAAPVLSVSDADLIGALNEDGRSTPVQSA